LWKALKEGSLVGDSIGAVTGRQRVMNARQQGDQGEGIVADTLRHVQRCDFELSFASTVGAFAAIGALPVLPGMLLLVSFICFIFFFFFCLSSCFLLFSNYLFNFSLI
jgi:hypothetical protein